MGLSANDLSAPAGDAFSWKDKPVGTSVEGTVTYVSEPYERDSKFGKGVETIVKVGLDTGNGEVAFLYPKIGSQMAQSIGDALREAGIEELAEGQTLRVQFVSEKDTGKGNPMKVYEATVGTPKPKRTI